MFMKLFLKPFIVFFLLGGITDGIAFGSEKNQTSDTEFEAKCRKAVAEYLQYINDPNGGIDPTDSTWRTYTENRYCDAIVSFGVPALNCVVQIMKDNETNMSNFYALSGVVHKISKRQFEQSYPLRSKWHGAQAYGKAFIEWWNKGRVQWDDEFAEYYMAWKRRKAGEERDKAYNKLKELGCLSLSYAIETITTLGDIELWDVVDYWTDGKITEDFNTETGGAGDKITFVSSWWNKNKDYWLLPPVEDAEFYSKQQISAADIALFSRLVDEWWEYVLNEPSISLSSRTEPYVENEYFQKIIDMGPPVLPLIAKNMEDRGLLGACMYDAFLNISKRWFSDEERGGRFVKVNALIWWKTGRGDTKNQFNDRYQSWKNNAGNPPRGWKDIVDDNGRLPYQDLSHDPELQAYRSLLALGIDALPYAIEKIEKGNIDLWDVVDYWTDSKITDDFNAETSGAGDKIPFVSSWWNKNKDYWLLPPVADISN